MHIEILNRPGNAAAQIKLEPRETFTAEAGAMISMSGDMRIETSTQTRGGGGVLSAIKRSLAGESFFLNHFTAGPAGGEVWLATALPGDMTGIELGDEKLVVQAGSFVACEESVELDMSWEGFKTMFSGESMFWLGLTGPGKVVVNSFGAIYPIGVDGEYIVDTGHIVAFSEGLDFSITKAGKSWVSSFLGGEGLVCKFRGRGAVWCQSHDRNRFGRTLGPMLKPRSQ